MKLKKIVSLALAGVLAVSMLAGCSNGTSDKTETTTEEPVADTSIVSMINTAITGNKAGISFTSDADFNAEVAKAVAQKGADTAADIETAVQTELKTGDHALSSTGLNATSAGKVTAVEVYVVSGKNMSAETGVYQLTNNFATNVNGLLTKQVISSSAPSAMAYTYSEAYASMVKVAVGETNYYVIALHLTCEAKTV